jgi:thiamine-phosphate pyrophosphorylase
MLNEGRSGLPPLVLMTDDERLSDPVAAARILPRGSMIVVRARQSAHRTKLAQSLRPIARARGLLLLIANDPSLADRVGAAGLHLSEINQPRAASWRARRPNWLITTAAHSLTACVAARRFQANAVFLSPIFATSSHKDGRHLGVPQARVIAASAPLPVYAMGGLDAMRARRLVRSRFAGLAAIGALAA